MFSRSMWSGDCTYWRSSARACLSVARSTIQRLLRRVLSKVRVKAAGTYLCELAQKSVAIEACRRGKRTKADCVWSLTHHHTGCLRLNHPHHESAIENANGAWSRPPPHQILRPQIPHLTKHPTKPRSKRRLSKNTLRRLPSRSSHLRPPSSSSSSSLSSSDSEDDAIHESKVLPTVPQAPFVKSQGSERGRARSPSPSPPPVDLPSFLPAEGSRNRAQEEQALRDRFRQFWMSSVADAFSDDLEQIRKVRHLLAYSFAFTLLPITPT
jgi:hypothetical protein